MQKRLDPADAFQRALDTGADEPELERLVELTNAITKLRAETAAVAGIAVLMSAAMR